MTVHKTKIVFDDTAQVVVKGKVAGREVEYTGSVNEMTVAVDDGIDERDWWYRYDHKPDYAINSTTYSFAFSQVDGKAITAKIGKKKIRRQATAFFDRTGALSSVRTECAAPVGADYEIDDKAKEVTFMWTEEVL